MSFAFELTSGQWSRSTENWTSALSEFQQHLSAILSPIPCGLSSWKSTTFSQNQDQWMTIVLFQIFSSTEIRVWRLPDILLRCLLFHRKCRGTSTYIEFFLGKFLVFLLIWTVNVWLLHWAATYWILRKYSTRIPSAHHQFCQSFCNFEEDFNYPNLCSHASFDWGFSKIFPRHNTESEKT